MNNEKCLNCIEKKRCRDSYTSWIFFIVGIIATIAVRLVTVVSHANPVYGKIAWYVGISGFCVFFMYKFKLTRQRAKLIRQQDIVNKINHNKQLTNQDYMLISGILCSLSSKKDRINYFLIFALSALALILAMYMDFIR